MTSTKRPWPGPETAPYRRGSLLEYVAGSDVREQRTATDHYAIPDEWRPNRPFRAALTLTGVERGRSAARFTWVDASHSGETVTSYPMFMVDACALMMSGEALVGAVRDGWWIVMKRGANYGVAAYPTSPVGPVTCPVGGQSCATCRIGGSNGFGDDCARHNGWSDNA